MENGKIDVVKRNEIYSDAEEKYLKATVLYGHTDKYLYFEEAHQNKVDMATLLNLCYKGLIVSYNGFFCMPVCYKENAGHLEVTVATGTTTLTGVVLYSEEYAAG